MTKPKNNESQLNLDISTALLRRDVEIAAAFSNDLKHPSKSRRGIADELSSLLGRSITEAQLSNWASESHRKHRLPLDVATAIVKVTGKSNALAVAVDAAEIKIITGKDIHYLTLIKKQMARQRLDREIVALEENLR